MGPWDAHGMRLRQTPAIWLGSHLLRAFYSEDLGAKWGEMALTEKHHTA